MSFQKDEFNLIKVSGLEVFAVLLKVMSINVVYIANRIPWIGVADNGLSVYSTGSSTCF